MDLRHAPLMTAAALMRAALGLAFSLLAIRVIGAAAFGYFSLVWSFCSAFLFMFTGVNTVLVARMVTARADGEDGAWMTAGLVLTVAAIGILGSLSAVAASLDMSSNDLRVAMILCPLMLACQVLTLYCCATLEGRGHMAWAVLLPTMGNLIVVVSLAATMATGANIPGLPTLLAITLGAYAAEAALAMAMSLTRVKLAMSLRWDRSTIRSLLTGGLSTQAANMVGFLLDPWSKGVLALHLGPTAVAIFDLSMKAGWGLHAVFSAYARLFLQIPPLEQDRRLASLRLAANLTWVPAALVAALGVTVLPPLLSAWLGVDQAALALGMAMALATCMLMTAVSAAFISLIGFQDHGFIFRNQMILGLANLVAAPLLVPSLGLAGAFVGGLAGTLLNVLLISQRLRHHMPAFTGLASLAKPFVGRLGIALGVFVVAWAASTQYAPLPASGALALAAVALLIREPLARATWQRFSGR